MKTRNYIALMVAGAALAASCTRSDAVDFGVDTHDIAAAADGGTHVVRISAGEHWEASTVERWISVSPANGRGSVDCKIIIDSALTAEPRTGVVRFENTSSNRTMEINVTQEGYGYSITIDDGNSEVEIPNYAFIDERHFDVNVRTNTDFEIEIPAEAGEWLSYDKDEVKLDRGLRPRRTKVRFNWSVSSEPAERTALVKFKPKSVTAERQDDLLVRQKAAPEIEAGTRAGDSVALICISRALNTWYSWESSEPMSNWSSVQLWEEGMECPDSCIGRVRSADFFLFDTKEGIPQEVQYLTAAESLSFRSNVNSQSRNLTPGEYISRLHNLKRLTIWAYGLNDIDESFTKLENLEYLDLAANNFHDFPQVLKEGRKNFRKLHALVLNANQRRLVTDLSNNNYSNEDMGGFISSTTPGGEFPRWLLEWEELDTLVLGVNYLQGHFPDLRDGWPTYDETDVANSKNSKGVDTLPGNGRFDFDWNADRSFNVENTPTSIIGLPKVWPNMKHLTINYNRMTGMAPDWLLFHPALDWWLPFTFIFNYEGKNTAGQVSKFDNEPATTMDYYYKFYSEKQNPYAGPDDNRGDGDCECGCNADCSCDSCNK